MKKKKKRRRKWLKSPTDAASYFKQHAGRQADGSPSRMQAGRRFTLMQRGPFAALSAMEAFLY